MTAYEAKQILITLKRQMRQKNVIEALAKAITVLAFEELEEDRNLFYRELDENKESGAE